MFSYITIKKLQCPVQTTLQGKLMVYIWRMEWTNRSLTLATPWLQQAGRRETCQHRSPSVPRSLVTPSLCAAGTSAAPPPDMPRDFGGALRVKGSRWPGAERFETALAAASGCCNQSCAKKGVHFVANGNLMAKKKHWLRVAGTPRLTKKSKASQDGNVQTDSVTNCTAWWWSERCGGPVKCKPRVFGVNFFQRCFAKRGTEDKTKASWMQLFSESRTNTTIKESGYTSLRLTPDRSGSSRCMNRWMYLPALPQLSFFYLLKHKAASI